MHNHIVKRDLKDKIGLGEDCLRNLRARAADEQDGCCELPSPTSDCSCFEKFQASFCSEAKMCNMCLAHDIALLLLMLSKAWNSKQRNALLFAKQRWADRQHVH